MNNSNLSAQTVLQIACCRGCVYIVNLLVENGAEVEGSTAIHDTVTFSRLEVVEISLDRGVNPNLPNLEGQTPFLLASSSNHLSIVRLLLKNNVLVNAQDPNGATPLSLALWNGDYEIVHALLRSQIMMVEHQYVLLHVVTSQL